MPIESADDLAVFFDPEEFGEAILYDGVGGFSAIWNRPTEDATFGKGSVTLDGNSFELPATISPQPVAGMSIAVIRTGDAFTIFGDPRLSKDGAVWLCGVSRA